MLFLPQRPYLILGDLRSQLLYPDGAKGILDRELSRVLERVNLADLPEPVGGFDSEHRWSEVLSTGEQQRLSLARLFLRHPRYAILDEATGGLDSENKSRIYSQIAESSMTVVSVTHNPTLEPEDRSLLTLLG